MTPLKYIQLAFTEIRVDVIRDFALSCSRGSGDFLAPLCFADEIMTLELTTNPTFLVSFPYECATLSVPTTRPLSKLTEKVDLQRIYENCSVLESQELSLDPVYVSECSVQPLEPQLVHASWARGKLPNHKPLFAVLTTYGALCLYTKPLKSSCWENKLIDLNKEIIDNVMPTYKQLPEKLAKFRDFQAYFERYRITTFAWDLELVEAEQHVLYATTGLGHIIRLQLANDAQSLVAHKVYETDMGRICAIMVLHKLVVAGNVVGIVKLYRIDNDAIELLETLWTRPDRMGVQQTIITYCKTSKHYFVVFTKAAHILAFALNEDGKLCSKTTMYLGGIKITGLQTQNATQFILTTINCNVYHIELKHTHNNNNNKLEITTQKVETEFEEQNYQILGVATTTHSNLWTFLLFRNKEYPQSFDYTRNAATISVGKLSSLNLFENTTFDSMSEYREYLTTVRLNIINELDLEKCQNYFDLSAAFDEPSIDFNEAFLKQLQIKHLITETIDNICSTKSEKSNLAEIAAHEIAFLRPSVQIAHIICRLQFLSQLESLTDFQKQSLNCMNSKLTQCNIELCALAADDENPIKEAISKFVQHTSAAFTAILCAIDNDNIDGKEYCLHCNESTTSECACVNKPHRCIISFVQLELNLESRYCSQCGSQAHEDETLLQQLYASHETIKCPICGCLFIYEDLKDNI